LTLQQLRHLEQFLAKSAWTEIGAYGWVQVEGDTKLIVEAINSGNEDSSMRGHLIAYIKVVLFGIFKSGKWRMSVGKEIRPLIF
jgi:hypothetical protein